MMVDLYSFSTPRASREYFYHGGNGVFEVIIGDGLEIQLVKRNLPQVNSERQKNEGLTNVLKQSTFTEDKMVR